MTLGRRRLVLLAVGTVLGLSTQAIDAQAQRGRDRQAPTFLRSQTFAGGGQSVTVAPMGGPQCRTSMSIRVQVGTQAFFANDQRELRSLWPQVLGYLQQSCPEMLDVEVLGIGQSVQVYRGQASAASSWELRHTRTPIDGAIEEIDRLRVTFENPRPLDAVVQKYSRLLGGADASDIAGINGRVEARKATLADEQIGRIAGEIEQIPETIEGLTRLGRHGRVLETLRQHYPSHVAKLETVLAQRERKIGAGALRQLELQLRDAPKGWREAAATAGAARQLGETWKGRIPEIVGVVERTVAEVEAALRDALAEFKAALAAYPRDWRGVKQSYEDGARIPADVSGLATLNAYVAALREWQQGVLVELVEASEAEIEKAGSTLDTLESVIDLGETAAKRFDEVGAKELSARIRLRLGQRVEKLVEANGEVFARQVEGVAPTQDGRRELLQAAQMYAALEPGIPAFARYRALAEKRANEIKDSLCRTALADFGSSGGLAERLVSPDGTIAMRDLVCAISIGGGRLTIETGLWARLAGLLSRERIAKFEDYNSSVTEFKLRASGGDASLMGVAIRRGDQWKTIGQEEWIEFVRIMIEGPPNGEADSAGRTECDRLAGDPQDPNRRGKAIGVGGTDIDPAILDRAVESCIAALENAPQEARLQYQLARLLWSAGDQEEAKPFLAAAVAQQYPAALHLQASIFLAESADYDRFVDAYTMFERAGKLGYPPAAQMVRELNPQGLPIYKDIPAPSSSDLVSTLPPSQCHEVFGVRSCIRFTGAQIKECMQISASDFMCEWKPVVSCDTGANPLFSAMLQAACSQTEYDFGTFRKSSDGRWRKIE